jgi:restriction system protein
MDKLPSYQELLTPLLKSLDQTGKAASNSEIEKNVISILGIPDNLTQEIHSGKRTELQYRLAWARTKAKTLGLISSTKREHWAITEEGKLRLSNG